MKKYIKTFELFNNKKAIHKAQELKNISILQTIINIEPDIVLHEGEFNPESWFRPGDLTPDKNNDQLITEWAGVSVISDMVTNEYEMTLPIKFKNSFKDEIQQKISELYNIISTKNTPLGFRIIKFTEK